MSYSNVDGTDNHWGGFELRRGARGGEEPTFTLNDVERSNNGVTRSGAAPSGSKSTSGSQGNKIMEYLKSPVGMAVAVIVVLIILIIIFYPRKSSAVDYNPSLVQQMGRIPSMAFNNYGYSTH